MKKELIFIGIMLLILPMVSAVNINLNDNYKPGETLIGTIEGNFLNQLKLDDFYFYSDRSQIPLVFDSARIQDKYYFYALLPVVERNYTLIIRNAHYYENGREIISDLEKSFTVSGNVADFSVYPGFLIMKNQSHITLESLNQPLSVSVNFLDSIQDVNVPIAQKKKVKLEARGIETFTLAEIEISALDTKYLVPVAILSSSEKENINLSDAIKFRFSKSEYNTSVYEKETASMKIYLQNLGNIPLDNINIILSDTLKDIVDLSDYKIDSLGESESKEIILSITPATYKTYFGIIAASSGNYSAETYLTINSIQTGQPLPDIPDSTDRQASCYDLQGGFCLEAQQCSGEIVDSIEGECCVGSCIQATSYTSTIIGIVLILIVAAGLYFLYKRYKKAKPGEEDGLKRAREKYAERISPKEVSGNLTRE